MCACVRLVIKRLRNPFKMRTVFPNTVRRPRCVSYTACVAMPPKERKCLCVLILFIEFDFDDLRRALSVSAGVVRGITGRVCRKTPDNKMSALHSFSVWWRRSRRFFVCHSTLVSNNVLTRSEVDFTHSKISVAIARWCLNDLHIQRKFQCWMCCSATIQKSCRNSRWCDRRCYNFRWSPPRATRLLPSRRRVSAHAYWYYRAPCPQAAALLGTV